MRGTAAYWRKKENNDGKEDLHHKGTVLCSAESLKRTVSGDVIA